MKSSLPVFISLPSLKSPLFYALPYPAKQRHFNFRQFAFKTVLFTPIFVIVLAACLSSHQPKNLFAAPQTITSPGLSVTIDNDDPFTFQIDAGVVNSTQQNLAVNTTSAGGYTINMETGGFTFTPAGQNQPQTILTSDLVNVAEPNDTTKRITSLTTDTPYNNIQNAYGYNFSPGNLTVTGSTIFKPVPAINTPEELTKTTTKNTTDDDYTLSIAVNADMNTPSGTYQNTLNILITANIADYTIYFCDNKDLQNPCDNPTQQLISEGIPEQLDPNPYTRPGYTFTGWNTKPDGTGTTYPANYETSPGHEIEDENGVQATSGGSVNLYAQWAAQEYTVIYNGNTATSGTMPNQTILRDTPTNLTKNQYTKTGYYFAGWADAPDGNVLYTDEQQVENLAPKNGTITLYAKWTTSQYNVVYDGNHATSGTTASQTVGYNEQLPLNANGFNRTGSNFLGWATTSWANTPKYTNSQTLTPAQVNELVAGLGHGDTVTLYAVWETPLMKAYEYAGKTKVNGYYTMQDMNPSICYSTNVKGDASITPVLDTRDNKIYLVTKLADDRCWMVQNLDHDIDANRTYTPADTDIPANWKPDKSTYATNDTTWDSTDTGRYIQQSYDPGNKIWDGTTVSSNSININNMTQGTNIHYHLGNYYNWGAAVAMNDTSVYTTAQDVNRSICPKGWMLPKGGAITTSGSLVYLISQYNWSNNSMTNPYIWQSPLYFPLSGRWVGGSGYIGYEGDFWSSFTYGGNFTSFLGGNSDGGARPTHPADRYHGFSVRCIARNNYTVKFNSNGGTGTMPDQSMEYGAYTNLANYSFTPPANKTFIGWNTNANGTGTSYQNTASVVNLAGSDTSTTLYAQYGVTLAQSYASAGKTQQNGYYKLQDMTPGICAATTIIDEAGQIQTIDIRDNKVYWITKLQDGKCWMTQNLDLNLDSSKTYTHADTDLGWGSNTATTTWKPANSTIDASNVTNNNVPSWVGSDSIPYSVDPGEVYWNKTRSFTAAIFMNNDFGSDPVKFQRNTPFTSNGTHGAVGNYYNWPAAIASNDASSYNFDTTSNIASNPQNSICPAGWRLPTVSTASSAVAGSTNEFGRLNLLYNGGLYTPSENFENSPFYPVRSGNFFNRQSYNPNVLGHYWSSSVNSAGMAYYLGVESNTVNTQPNAHRVVGRSVRCVAR